MKTTRQQVAKVSKTVLQCLKTRPRVHTFTSTKSLNNDNIIKSYGNPSKCDKESLQSSYHGVHKTKSFVGYETTSKLFFPINPLSYSYKCHEQPQSSYQNKTLRHKSTKTLMQPRYSNVTSSIHWYDYTICITQSQIHLFKPTQRTSKSAPKILSESQDENMCQPLCISSRGHGTRKLITKTYIKWVT